MSRAPVDDVHSRWSQPTFTGILDEMVARALLIIGTLLIAGVAHTEPAVDPARAQAKALFDSGMTHYNLGEFVAALKDFKEAYRLVHDPALLFNVAQCQRQLHDFVEAAKLYRAYRREYPDAPNREEVDRLIAQMDTAAATQRAAQPPAPAATAPPPPIMQSPTQPTAVAKSRREHVAAYKKPWVWGVVGVAVVAAAGITVGVVLGTTKRDTAPQLPDVRF